MKHQLWVIGLSLFIHACSSDNSYKKYEALDKQNSFSSGEPISPITIPTDLDQDKVALGKLLFHENKLSFNNTISCASCHDLKKGGIDGTKVSIGVVEQKGDLNAPSVFNASNNFRQFWDGRSVDLMDQIDGPITNPVEMNSNWKEIIPKLSKDPIYLEKFNALFDDGITEMNIKTCITEFEKSLITPSRFDQYLLGDKTVLSTLEKEGYQLFKNYGCISCHQGKNIGGNMYQKFGVVDDYFKNRGNVKKSDYGRYNVTGKESDRYYFKVPSLRNVALTAPYFHDGETGSLEEAVKIMAKYQIGRTIPNEDVHKIVAFLNTLTGENL